MRRNASGYAFNDWTPRRKARFVELRLRGMHPHWAVFWALIDRKASKYSVYTEEQVQEFLTLDEHPAGIWRQPIGSKNRFDFDLMPPQELFDALEKD